MFKQYKESMRNDMLNEISLAKKAALLKIVDSGTVTKGNRLVLFSAGCAGCAECFVLFCVDLVGPLVVVFWDFSVLWHLGPF